MHCEFMCITNAFQIRFDIISNALGNKGDRNKICILIYIINLICEIKSNVYKIFITSSSKFLEIEFLPKKELYLQT